LDADAPDAYYPYPLVSRTVINHCVAELAVRTRNNTMHPAMDNWTYVRYCRAPN